MLEIKNTVKEVWGYHRDNIPRAIIQGGDPVVLKGVVSDWPIVKAGLTSDESAAAYIKSFYVGHTVVVYQAEAEKQGRFFYSEDYSKLNFNSDRVPLDGVIDRIIACKKEPEPDTYYVGSTTVDVCLPGLRQDNDLNLNDCNPLVSIWIGNRSRIAAHFDAPDNIACCVAGKRRFTLFPIEQAENLYMGPLDLTPSGQVISSVDFKHPDYEKFPKFRTALKHAVVAELEPGDALYLPSMWWHHVESMSDFNVLINYWWRDAPRYMEPPVNLLHHAMLSLRDLPNREKRAWKALFDYYIFDEDAHKYDHIPEAARGFLNPIDEIQARRLRSWLLNK